jgi:hypothetical protein
VERTRQDLSRYIRTTGEGRADEDAHPSGTGVRQGWEITSHSSFSSSVSSSPCFPTWRTIPAILHASCRNSGQSFVASTRSAQVGRSSHMRNHVDGGSNCCDCRTRKSPFLLKVRASRFGFSRSGNSGCLISLGGTRSTPSPVSAIRIPPLERQARRQVLGIISATAKGGVENNPPRKGDGAPMLALRPKAASSLANDPVNRTLEAQV